MGSHSFLPAISFRSVNLRGSWGYNPEAQRHHILPMQLLGHSAFEKMIAMIGKAAIGFDDFRRNGLLLPSTEAEAGRTHMPLHRGPHRQYNEVVIERFGQIEGHWARCAGRNCLNARADLLFRVRLLQNGLRRSLLNSQRFIVLNRKDPVGAGTDFREMDAMAEMFWNSTEECQTQGL